LEVHGNEGFGGDTGDLPSRVIVRDDIFDLDVVLGDRGEPEFPLVSLSQGWV
jgi:hypothetical protein